MPSQVHHALGLRNRLAPRLAHANARYLEIVHDRQVAEKSAGLKRARHALAPQLVGHDTVEHFAIQLNGPRADGLEPCQHVDKCGFPGAVGADQSGDGSPRNRERNVGQRFQAFELDADVASGQLQVTGSHLNAFSLAANYKRSFALRETLVKFEILFADIGNYDDADVPAILPDWAALVVALWSRGTVRLARGQDRNERRTGTHRRLRILSNSAVGIPSGPRLWRVVDLYAASLRDGGSSRAGVSSPASSSE